MIGSTATRDKMTQIRVMQCSGLQKRALCRKNTTEFLYWCFDFMIELVNASEASRAARGEVLSAYLSAAAANRQNCVAAAAAAADAAAAGSKVGLKTIYPSQNQSHLHLFHITPCSPHPSMMTEKRLRSYQLKKPLESWLTPATKPRFALPPNSKRVSLKSHLRIAGLGR